MFRARRGCAARSFLPVGIAVFDQPARYRLMKILTVALTATSIALAGTSAYLWRQLEGERQKVVAAELALAKARTAVPDARPHEPIEDASVEPAGPNALATALPGARVAETGAQESPA